MPKGTGRGDGDPGSLSRHFGYLESYEIISGVPCVKAYRRTGPDGRKLDPGKSSEFELKRYVLFEVPKDVNLGNGKYDIPWIHIAHLSEGEATTDSNLGPQDKDKLNVRSISELKKDLDMLEEAFEKEKKSKDAN